MTSLAHQHPNSERKLRVLHVEDDANDAYLIRRALNKNGYDVAAHLVSSQAEFHTAILNPDFDIILADQSLSGFSGTEALNMARETCPHVPFVFVSGSMGEI